MTNNPYYLKFLINAIFALLSKYSERFNIRDDLTDPRSTGIRFIRRYNQLLFQELLFQNSSILFIVGFLLLDFIFNSRGETFKD